MYRHEEAAEEVRQGAAEYRYSLKESFIDWLGEGPVSESFVRAVNAIIGYPFNDEEIAKYCGSPEEISEWIRANQP